MADIQKVSIALTREQIATLRAAVDAGEYPTISEIVREALRDWQVRREVRQENLKRLQQLWDEGVASGPAEPLDFGELRVAARQQVKAATKAPGDGR